MYLWGWCYCVGVVMVRLGRGMGEWRRRFTQMEYKPMKVHGK